MQIIMGYGIEFSLIHGSVECISTLAVFVVAFVCTTTCSLIIDHAQEMDYMMVETYSPKVFVFFISIAITKLFTFLYDIGCDSILHCYIYNKEYVNDRFGTVVNSINPKKYEQLEEKP